MQLNMLMGKTLKSIERLDKKLIFELSDDERWVMLHVQDCCESVYIEDIVGDLDDLIGSPILMAEESVSKENPDKILTQEDAEDDDDGWGYPESETWTFYKFATIKGYVTIRWYGTSNGYYSESVSVVREGTGYDY